MQVLILTNNPLVKQKLGGDFEVIFEDVPYEKLFEMVRDRVHLGHKLLTHPLSGSIKPKETPYKSVMISKKMGKMDNESLMIIESCIEVARKFPVIRERLTDEIKEDFQLVDCTLIESAIPSLSSLVL